MSRGLGKTQRDIVAFMREVSQFHTETLFTGGECWDEHMGAWYVETKTVQFVRPIFSTLFFSQRLGVPQRSIARAVHRLARRRMVDIRVVDPLRFALNLGAPPPISLLAELHATKLYPRG